MNRLSGLTLKIAAAALAVVVFAGVPAEARDKKTAHKKKVDLSANPLAGVNSKQPDKELFDKAMVAMKKGRYDVSRLDLQTMLNTYPESEYRMRAKLAVGDSWFKEGGSAALMQAEAEYKDFITFFPNAPEAAEAQMKVGDIYYQQMEKPDRDYNNAQNAEREYRNMINQYPDSTLVPRAKQKLRETQEVLAERETQIGLYYESRDNYTAAIARLQTVVDTFPLYSKSDQALLGIGDAYAGEAHAVQIAPGLPGAIRERLRSDLPGPGRGGLRQGDYPLSDGPSRRRCPRPPGGHESPRPRAYSGCACRERCRRAQPPAFALYRQDLRHHQAWPHGGAGSPCGRTQRGRSQADPGAGYHQGECRPFQRRRQCRQAGCAAHRRGDAHQHQRAPAQRPALRCAATA